MTDNLAAPTAQFVRLAAKGLVPACQARSVSENFRQNIKTPLTKAADSVF